MSTSRNDAVSRPRELRISGIGLKDSDVPRFLYESLQAITFREVWFQTTEVREKFLCRLMESKNLTRICIQHESLLPLSEFSRKLVRGRPLKLTTIWLELVKLTQTCLDLLAVALKVTPQIDWLELFDPRGDNFKYATIIELGIKLKKFHFVSAAKIPQAELFLVRKGLLANDCKLEEIKVIHENRWTFSQSPMNQKFMIASVERCETLVKVNEENRSVVASLWPTFTV